MTTSAATRYVTIRHAGPGAVRLFSGQPGVTEYRASVESDGTVRVYDSTGDIYTIHHALSARQHARVRREAAGTDRPMTNAAAYARLIASRQPTA